jgi:hypothetical protein
VSAVLLVLVAIGIHYEGLRLTGRALEHMPRAGRLRVALAIVGAMSAHVSEAIVFGFGIEGMLLLGFGELRGATGAIDLRDTLYFSIITYSSVGYGDLAPVGALRIVAGVEAITGLVMIAWTASFTFLEMGRYWGREA